MLERRIILDAAQIAKWRTVRSVDAKARVRDQPLRIGLFSWIPPPLLC